MTSLLADLVVALHAAYVAFVVLLPVLVLLGAAIGWRWVRNPWVRNLHLAMISIVVGESLVGFECPLTTWEDNLRTAAGQSVAGGTFIGRWLHNLVFVEVEPEALTPYYVGFGFVVAVLYITIRPERSKPASNMSVDDDDSNQRTQTPISRE